MSGTMIQFTRGENPLRADKLNAALAERLWRNGDTMAGSLFLWRDPQAPSEAATKQYVDGQINSVVSGTVVRAVNGRAGYVQLNSGDITTALGYTPYDAANPAGYISAASAPVRSVAGKQGTVTLVHTDITDWAATLAPYALIASIPIAATTLPLIAGVAAVGVNGAWARADHVHPSEVTGASFLPTTYQSGGTVDYNTLLSSTTGLNSLHQFGGPLLSANGPSGGTADKGTVLVTYAANTSWTSQLFLGDGGNVVNQGIWYRQMDGGGTWTGMAWHRVITDEGGVMLGSLTLAGDPTAPLMAVTKQYVDVVKGAIEDYLPLTGGTLTGPLTVARSSGGGANLTADASGGSGNWANLQLMANPLGACAINSFKYGLLRWTVEIGGTTAETGGNVGTDFALTAYNDDGTFLGYPVTVERGTGNVAITMGGLVVAGGVNAEQIITRTAGGFGFNAYAHDDNEDVNYLQDGFGAWFVQDPLFGDIYLYPFASGAADTGVSYGGTFGFGQDGSFAATSGIYGTDDRALGMYDDGNGNRWMQFNPNVGWLYNTLSNGPLQWITNNGGMFSIDNACNVRVIGSLTINGAYVDPDTVVLPYPSALTLSNVNGGVNLVLDASQQTIGWWAEMDFHINDTNSAAFFTYKIRDGQAPMARWSMLLGDATAEVGGNSGCDFYITRFDDTGNPIDAPLSVLRATGQVNVTNALMVGGDVGFHGATPMAKPPVTGAKAGNAALASLLAVLVSYGLITDSTAA